MDRNNTMNETSDERRRRLNRERQQRYRKNKRNVDSDGPTELDHPGEKKVCMQGVVSDIMDETSEEHQQRLNRERQRRYRENKRNVDSDGPTGLEQFLENNMSTAEQEVVIPPTTVLLKTSKARVYPWCSQDERKKGTSTRSPIFTTCCAKGKVSLPPIEELPHPLNMLLTRTDPSARLFRKNIRSYNSALAFTSMGAKVDNSITGTSGVYSFRVHGEMYHSIGTMLPDNEARPQFAQIYVYDTEHELQNRMNVMPNLDPVILEELQQMLHDVNPYCEMFKQAGDIVRLNPSLDLQMVITDSRKEDSLMDNYMLPVQE
ncbi:11336_t:CDS:2 [Entrophospora sp. SA101]|nr:11336_t:CDS:2 [Entrophospora sp. SA101]